MSVTELIEQSDYFQQLLERLGLKEDLSEADAVTAFDALISGSASSSQIADFLLALRDKGETVDELVGAAQSMRQRMLAVEAPSDAIDTCGTGGDNSGSFNVSTAAAFVIAGCGVPVAKHGNSAVSSKSGSADVLAALGINLGANPVTFDHALSQAGIAFLMAPHHHPATRYVAEARRNLGVRTIFNLLGPLTNPAGVRRHLVGVFAPNYTRPLAEALQRLGSLSAWVVHGDGMDEMTTTGITQVTALKDGMITNFEVTPEEVGLRRVGKTELVGGSPIENAAMLLQILAGQKGPLRDIVLLNAAAALIVAGRVSTLTDGMRLAARSIDDGAAHHCLDQLVTLSQQAA